MILKWGKANEHLLVCLNNEGFEASLEKRKLYIALEDEQAAKHKLVRVVDEAGEDYLYPSSFFCFIELPPRLRRAVLQAV